MRSCEQRRCLVAEGTFVKASAFCLPLFGSGSTGLGNADKNRNQIGFYAGAGLVYSALMMEDDLFGIGLAYARNNDEYVDFNPGADDFEMALECTYEFHPNPWLTLQPGLQFIKNPGMKPDLDDAVAISLRAYMSF